MNNSQSIKNNYLSDVSAVMKLLKLFGELQVNKRSHLTEEISLFV